MSKIDVLIVVLVVAVTFAAYGRVYGRRAFEGLSYTCHFESAEVYQGGRIVFVEEVSNRKYLPVPWLKAEITTSKYLTFPESRSAVTYRSRFVSSCYSVGGNRSVQRRWDISASRRGVFSIEGVVLSSCGVLGTHELSMPVRGVDAKVTVLPLEVDTPEVDYYVRGIVGEFQARNSLLTDAFSMRGVREYTGHERLSHIHWKDSAKQSKLMVVEEEHSSDADVVVYLYLEERCEESLAEKALSTACTVACRLSEGNVPVRLDSNCRLSTASSYGVEHSLDVKRACAEADLSPESLAVPTEAPSSTLVVVTTLKNAPKFETLEPSRLLLVRL